MFDIWKKKKKRYLKTPLVAHWTSEAYSHKDRKERPDKWLSHPNQAGVGEGRVMKTIQPVGSKET